MESFMFKKGITSALMKLCPKQLRSGHFVPFVTSEDFGTPKTLFLYNGQAEK